MVKYIKILNVFENFIIKKCHVLLKRNSNNLSKITSYHENNYKFILQETTDIKLTHSKKKLIKVRNRTKLNTNKHV